MSNVDVVQGKWQVVRPTGEIDFANVDEFDAVLSTAVKQSPKGIIIDLCCVTYFDSAGMRSILYAYTRLHDAGGKLALVVRTRNVKTLIEALNLEDAPGMSICDSVEAAEQALSADSGDQA